LRKLDLQTKRQRLHGLRMGEPQRQLKDEWLGEARDRYLRAASLVYFNRQYSGGAEGS
jgi:hypothetical protein